MCLVLNTTTTTGCHHLAVSSRRSSLLKGAHGIVYVIHKLTQHGTADHGTGEVVPHLRHLKPVGEHGHVCISRRGDIWHGKANTISPVHIEGIVHIVPVDEGSVQTVGSKGLQLGLDAVAEGLCLRGLALKLSRIVPAGPINIRLASCSDRQISTLDGKYPHLTANISMLAEVGKKIMRCIPFAEDVVVGGAFCVSPDDVIVVVIDGIHRYNL